MGKKRVSICVNGECFRNVGSATRYILELASRGEKVTVNHRVEEAREESESPEKALAATSGTDPDWTLRH